MPSTLAIFLSQTQQKDLNEITTTSVKYILEIQIVNGRYQSESYLTFKSIANETQMLSLLGKGTV